MVNKNINIFSDFVKDNKISIVFDENIDFSKGTNINDASVFGIYTNGYIGIYNARVYLDVKGWFDENGIIVKPSSISVILRKATGEFVDNVYDRLIVDDTGFVDSFSTDHYVWDKDNLTLSFKGFSFDKYFLTVDKIDVDFFTKFLTTYGVVAKDDYDLVDENIINTGLGVNLNKRDGSDFNLNYSGYHPLGGSGGGGGQPTDITSLDPRTTIGGTGYNRTIDTTGITGGGDGSLDDVDITTLTPDSLEITKTGEGTPNLSFELNVKDVSYTDLSLLKVGMDVKSIIVSDMSKITDECYIGLDPEHTHQIVFTPNTFSISINPTVYNLIVGGVSRDDIDNPYFTWSKKYNKLTLKDGAVVNAFSPSNNIPVDTGEFRLKDDIGISDVTIESTDDTVTSTKTVTDNKITFNLSAAGGTSTPTDITSDDLTIGGAGFNRTIAFKSPALNDSQIHITTDDIELNDWIATIKTKLTTIDDDIAAKVSSVILESLTPDLLNIQNVSTGKDLKFQFTAGEISYTDLSKLKVDESLKSIIINDITKVTANCGFDILNGELRFFPTGSLNFIYNAVIYPLVENNINKPDLNNEFFNWDSADGILTFKVKSNVTGFVPDPNSIPVGVGEYIISQVLGIENVVITSEDDSVIVNSSEIIDNVVNIDLSAVGGDSASNKLIYLSNIGDDTNDGLTALTPVATLKKAVQLTEEYDTHDIIIDFVYDEDDEDINWIKLQQATDPDPEYPDELDIHRDLNLLCSSFKGVLGFSCTDTNDNPILLRFNTSEIKIGGYLNSGSVDVAFSSDVPRGTIPMVSFLRSRLNASETQISFVNLLDSPGLNNLGVQDSLFTSNTLTFNLTQTSTGVQNAIDLHDGTIHCLRNLHLVKAGDDVKLFSGGSTGFLNTMEVYTDSVINPIPAGINGFKPEPFWVTGGGEGKVIIYLSCNGDDTNDGLTSDTPVATLQKAYELTQLHNTNHIIAYSYFEDVDNIGFIYAGYNVIEELELVGDLIIEPSKDSNQLAFLAEDVTGNPLTIVHSDGIFNFGINIGAAAITGIQRYSIGGMNDRTLPLLRLDDSELICPQDFSLGAQDETSSAYTYLIMSQSRLKCHTFQISSNNEDNHLSIAIDMKRSDIDCLDDIIIDNMQNFFTVNSNGYLKTKEIQLNNVTDDTIPLTVNGFKPEPFWCSGGPIPPTSEGFTLKVTEAGDFIIHNVWNSDITYAINPDTDDGRLGAGPQVVLGPDENSVRTPLNLNDIIVITEGVPNETFRSWINPNYNPLITARDPDDQDTDLPGLVEVVSMPTMSAFTTTNSGTQAPNGFFYGFNIYGAINSFPPGSLNISNIQTVGESYFAFFNANGKLATLPPGSFHINNITQAPNNFFRNFATNSSITSLPLGSFNTSNIISTQDNFFYGFLQSAELITELPGGSFNTSNIIQCGDDFFTNFANESGLTSLPVGSFNLSKLGTVGNSFFERFNYTGALEALPEGSFDISKISSYTINDFFTQFNETGALTSLPIGSFKLNTINVEVGDNFFNHFNYDGGLATLPVGSFDTGGITTIGNGYFNEFNNLGKLRHETIGVLEVLLPNNTAESLTYHYWDGTNSQEIIIAPTEIMLYDSPESIPVPGSDIEIEITTAGSFEITNIWGGDINFRVNDEPLRLLTSGALAGLGPLAIGSIIEIYEGEPNVTFRTFGTAGYLSLIHGDATGKAKINKIPPMSSFTTDEAGTIAGDNFFQAFNDYGCLISLPEDSFDLSDITACGLNFFEGFNYNGSLISLPGGSFNTENIVAHGKSFFQNFNAEGALTSLPEDSFKLTSIANAGIDFFTGFNNQGSLISLPDGSFNTDNIVSTNTNFFSGFTQYGVLTTLPEGSFNINQINPTSIYANFFFEFNQYGSLTTLPIGSFDTSRLTGTYLGFMQDFNLGGKIGHETTGVKQVPLTNNSTQAILYYYWDGTTRQDLTINPGETMYYDSPDVHHVGEIVLRAVYDGDFTITNKWAKDIKYTTSNGLNGTIPTGGASPTLTLALGDTITISEVQLGTFREWEPIVAPLIASTNSKVEIVSIPPMAEFTLNDGRLRAVELEAGDNFFFAFNSAGAINWLPTGSFDTSNITAVGNNFFAHFNSNGSLSSLPIGSFKIEGITIAKSGFFQAFNNQGYIQSLPVGSFDTSNIVSVDNDFFMEFNGGGNLLHLPVHSFNLDHLVSFGNNFFAYFNRSGQLRDLPTSSFNIGSLTLTSQVGFLYFFNNEGMIKTETVGIGQVSLNNNTGYPIDFYYWDGTVSVLVTKNNGETMLYDSPDPVTPTGDISLLVGNSGTFVLSNIWETDIIYSINGGAPVTLPTRVYTPAIPLAVGDIIEISESTPNVTFREFETSYGYSFITSNDGGTVSVTLIPPMNRFTTDVAGTTAGTLFFRNFNAGNTDTKGCITRLPAGSFDTSTITDVGDSFFDGFNSYGLLRALPYGSFDTSNIGNIESSFFYAFNGHGELLTLPINSFKLDAIIDGSNFFFASFNDHGKLRNLPIDSFKTDNIASAGIDFFADFNYGGASLVSLPDNSFRFTSLISVGASAFSDFNRAGALVSLPVGSFNIDALNAVGNGFGYSFNNEGQLTTLPTNSFNTANIATYGTEFLSGFNSGGINTGMIDSEVPGVLQVALKNVTDYPLSFWRHNPDGLGQHTVIKQPGEIMYYNSPDPIVHVPNTITITVTTPDTYVVHNRWTTPITYSVNGAYPITVASNAETPELALVAGDTIEIAESTPNSTFRFWRLTTVPFIRALGTGTVKITDMAAFNYFTLDELGTTVNNNYFFRNFNRDGCITEFPAGSFDTNTLTTVTGTYCFANFNDNGLLTSLPEGSFKFNNLVNISDRFLSAFNFNGVITSLPVESFRFNSLDIVGNQCFMGFNGYGALTTLPVGSFNMDTVTFVGDDFFNGFNLGGLIPKQTPDILQVPIINKATYNVKFYYYDGYGSSEINIVPGETMYYDSPEPLPPVCIEIGITTAGTFVLNNKWTQLISYNINGGPDVDIGGGAASANLNLGVGDKIVLKESTSNVTFRTWSGTTTPLISSSNGGQAKINIIPPMSNFTVDEAGTTAGNYFFMAFNYGGVLTSLPDGSFDTSTITTVGDGFFGAFNSNGALTSLPAGSFKIDGISIAPPEFFIRFNYNGSLISLPDGSFNTGNLVSISGESFNRFNSNGALITLPVGSFNLDNVVSNEDYVFNSFNSGGALINLPVGSFNISNLTGTNFIKYFNDDEGKIRSETPGIEQVALTNMSGYPIDFYYWDGTATVMVTKNNGETMLYDSPQPFVPTTDDIEIEVTKAGQFTLNNQWTTNITYSVNGVSQGSLAPGADVNLGNLAIGDVIGVTEGTPDTTFRSFVIDDDHPLIRSSNGGEGKLNVIPSMNRFTINSTGMTAPEAFFYHFNNYGVLNSLPVGSFDISTIVNAGDKFFDSFNYHGKLTSLPNGSFDTSNIVSGSYHYFNSFNNEGPLVSLPVGSFKINPLKTFDNTSFVMFNAGGALTTLPVGSFDISNVTGLSDFMFDFNSNGKIGHQTVGVLQVPLVNNTGTYMTFQYWDGTVSQTITLAPGLTMYYDSPQPDTPTANDITIEVTKAGQFTLNNQWTTNINYSVNDVYQGSLASVADINLGNLNVGDVIGIGEGTPDTTFRTFYGGNYKPLIRSSDTGEAKLTIIPSMNKFTVDDTGVEAPSNFFSAFNRGGVLTSLPAGSFDLINIQTVHSYFFTEFNYDGLLTSLPDGSFNIDDISKTHDDFFSFFNRNGGLVTLPDNSFNTINIRSINVGDESSTGNFFEAFNEGGSLTSLPANSFKLDNIHRVSTGFFAKFNESGSLQSLPDGSFNTTNLTYCGANFFWRFNYDGDLTYLPEGSFNTDNVAMTNSTNCFRDFNNLGKIGSNTDTILQVEIKNVYNGNVAFYYWEDNTSKTTNVISGGHMSYDSPIDVDIEIKVIKAGQFTLNNQWTTNITYSVNGVSQGSLAPGADANLSNLAIDDIVGISEGTANTTFREFYLDIPPKGLVRSSNGGEIEITQIPPMNRFTTDNTGTTAGDNFFFGFNYDGCINKLPLGSFNTSNIVNVGVRFFTAFNYNGLLNELPPGSFNIDNIVDFKNYFFSSFNYHGELINLPTGSFNISNLVITSPGDQLAFLTSFNNNGKIRTESEDFAQIPLTNNTGGALNFHYWDGTTSVMVTRNNGEIMFYDSPEPAPISPDIVIEITKAGQFTLYNQWVGNISYSVNGIDEGDLSDIYIGNLNVGDVIKVYEEVPDSFRVFDNIDLPLVVSDVGEAKIAFMPPMNAFTTDNTGNRAPVNFFMGFNHGGALTSFPAGSFDTSLISIVGNNFFTKFNSETYSHQVTLPEGSFDISNINSAHNNFFAEFNRHGGLTELPEGSFDTKNINTVGLNFFLRFNLAGGLITLPVNSFDINEIASFEDNFFYEFNKGGYLENLPVGSFDISRLVLRGQTGFMLSFNSSSGRIHKETTGILQVPLINNTGESITFDYWDDVNSQQIIIPSGNIMYYDSPNSV